MKHSSRRFVLLAAIAGCAGVVQAEVYFSDNMEAQTFPLAAPPVGWGYSTQGSTGDPISIGAPAPGASNKAIKLIRVGTTEPVLGAYSNNNAMVSAASVEFSFDVFHQHVHRFNAPVQVQMGLPPYNQTSGPGRLQFVGVNDPNGGAYFASDSAGSPIQSAVQQTLNGWDRVRVVMTDLSVQSFPGFGDFLTGKTTVSVSRNGNPNAIIIANNVDLPFATIPAEDDPMTVGLDERTAAYMRFAKGPFSGDDYYDNIYVGSPIAATAATNWNLNGSGSWSSGGNWNPATAPSGIGAVANFGAINASAIDVSVDAPQTVGAIVFSSSNSYSLIGSSTITLDTSNAAAGILTSAGTHTISSPVVLAKDLGVTTDSGTSLQITGEITGTGKILSKAGTGSMTIENFRGAGLFVSQGIAKITKKTAPNDPSGTTSVGTLTVSPLAQIDLTNNSVIIDYETAGTEVTDMRLALKEARVFSSSAGDGRMTGYGDNALLGQTSFGGQTVDSTSLLVRFTWQGDNNLDGKVNTVDFNMLAGAFGSTDGFWTDGDYDYNSLVDSVDFNNLVASYGKTEANLGPTLGSVVPEPASLTLLGLGALMLVRRRKEGGA